MENPIRPRESKAEPKRPTARIRAKNQITLPQSICDKAGLSEGEFLAFHISEKRTVVEPGSIIVSPRQLVTVPRTPEEWEKAEQEADEDVKAGRVSKRYKGAKAAIAALRRKK